MTTLSQIQQHFLDHLLTGKSPLVEEVLDQGNINAQTRIAIYANAYRLRLKEVIETDHEILGLYLGDDLFDQMLIGYLKAYPSKHDSLRDFCQHLPLFLANTQPFSEHPILAELATFERLLLSAFDAADIERAKPESLGQIPPENWPTMKIRFHPSMQIFAEQWNTVHSWQLIKAEQAPEQAKQHAHEQHWLLWRNHERLTEFRSAPDDEYYMITEYLAGADFSDICEGLTAWYTPEAVPTFAVQTLQKWLQQGIIHQFI